MNLPSMYAFTGWDNERTRVTLNKWHGKRDAGDFTDELGADDLGFACWNAKSKHRFRKDMVNLVFVQTGPNRFLFVAALEITGESAEGPCEYRDATDEFGMSDLAMRLTVSDACPKKTKMGSWCFKADRLADLEIESFDKAAWSKLKWEGYDKVRLSFGMLYDIIEGNRYADYKAHLEDVCGVYALKDSATGKLYIGSAYGKAGVAQRWNHYLESLHGGNLLLKRLYDEKGPDYFRENFTFDLIREFPLGTKPETVIAFESKMKELLGTRDGGYNAN